MNSPSQGNHFLIDAFQVRFTFMSVLYFIAILLTFILAVSLPLLMQLEDPSLSLTEKAALATQFISFHQRLWIPLTLVLTLLMVHSIYFSHKIAGPLYQHRKIYQSILEGKLGTPVEVRKGDYLYTETELLSETMMSLQQRILMAKGHSAEVRAELENLKAAVVQRSTQEEIAHAVKQLEETTDRLQTGLDSLRATSQ